MKLIIKKKKKKNSKITPETKETNFQIDIKHLSLIPHSRVVFSPLFNFPVNVVDHRSNTLAFLALLIKGRGFNIGWT